MPNFISIKTLGITQAVKSFNCNSKVMCSSIQKVIIGISQHAFSVVKNCNFLFRLDSKVSDFPSEAESNDGRSSGVYFLFIFHYVFVNFHFLKELML